MRVGIIGIGFVGNALINALKKEVEVLKIDPKLNTTVQDLKDFNPDIIFISVPTPMNAESQDLSILYDVLKQIKLLDINTLLVLKSTVLPESIKKIEDDCARFIYNPEFLREKTANADFIESSFIIFGGKTNEAKVLSNFYSEYTYCEAKEHIFIDTVSASLVKYSINSFLASKVIFFNQLFEIFSLSKSTIDWQTLTDAISKDERIGSSHMTVPGDDGKKGFGGACFPKDTYALYKYSESLGVNFSLLKNVIDINNKIRFRYNDLSEREKAQNISYETK